MDKQSFINKVKSKLAESSLTFADKNLLGFKLLSSKATMKLGAHVERRAGILIPYFDPFGVKTKQWRYRYIEDASGIKANAKKPQRYTQPIGVMPQLYFPANHSWDKTIDNTSKPIFITEGEFKACCGCKFNFPTIAVGGVFNWKSKKRLLPEIPDLDLIKWNERDVYLVFDADLKENVMVQKALLALSKVLINRGAKPRIVFIPPLDRNEKAGMDDFLTEMGVPAFVELVENSESFSLQEELWKINDEVCYIMNPGIVVRKKNSQAMDPARFQSHHYRNRFYYEEVWKKDTLIMEKKHAAPKWIEWEYRNELEELCYEPGEPKVFNHKYNMWNPSGLESIKGSVKPWEDFMNYFFRGQPKARKWFESWVAIQIQQPGVKLHTAVVMYGETQGTGKSMIGGTIMKLFGEKNSVRISSEDLHNQFNDWASNVQFVVGDEVTSGKGRASNDKLKAMLTEPTIRMNQKFVPGYMIANHINFYFTTNHGDGFHLENTDRRYFVHRAPGILAPESFYSNFIEWRDNGGLAHLLYYFENYDIGNFNVSTKPLETIGRKTMLGGSQSELDTFIIELQESPKTLLREYKMLAINGLEIYSSTLLHKIFTRGRDNMKITPGGIAKACNRLGIYAIHNNKQFRTAEGRKSYFAFKNMDYWEKLDNKEVNIKVKDHIEKHLRKTNIINY